MNIFIILSNIIGDIFDTIILLLTKVIESHFWVHLIVLYKIYTVLCQIIWYMECFTIFCIEISSVTLIFLIVLILDTVNKYINMCLFNIF